MPALRQDGYGVRHESWDDGTYLVVEDISNLPPMFHFQGNPKQVVLRDGSAEIPGATDIGNEMLEDGWEVIAVKKAIAATAALPSTFSKP